MSLPLVPLLRLSWLTATLLIAAAFLPFRPLSLLRRSISLFSARGKTLTLAPPPRRPNLTVPQRYFLHFYALAAALAAVLIACTGLYAYCEMLPLADDEVGVSTLASHLAGGARIFDRRGILSSKEKLRVWRSVFALVMMEVQVARRLYETMAVFHYGPSARMHVVGYLTGLL